MKVKRASSAYADREPGLGSPSDPADHPRAPHQSLFLRKAPGSNPSTLHLPGPTKPIGAKTQSIVKVTFRPNTAQTAWLSHAPSAYASEPIVLADGMTIDQWRKINDFKIVGQSKYKKRNYNLAVDHFFNMRSMYKKINSLWINNRNPYRPKGQDAFEAVGVSRQSQVINPRISKVVAQPTHARADEDWENHNTVQQPVNTRYQTKDQAKAFKKQRGAEEAQGIHKTAEAARGGEGPKRKIKPTKTKTKKTEEGLQEGFEAGDVEDFRNTNEQELIESNINLAGLGQKVHKESKGQPPQQPKNVSSEKFGGSKSKKGLDSGSKHESERQPRQIVESEVIARNQAGRNHLPTDNNEDIEEETPFEDSVNHISRGSKNRDTHHFDTADLQHKIKSGAHEDEADEGEDEEDIMDKIPILQGKSDDQLQQFKQQLINTIVTYEIFDEEEFQNFFEAVCLRNQDLSRQFLGEVFEEIKAVLVQQFQELSAEAAAEDE